MRCLSCGAKSHDRPEERKVTARSFRMTPGQRRTPAAHGDGTPSVTVAAPTAPLAPALAEHPALTAAGHLLDTAAASGWAGPDPYDALWTKWPTPLVGGRRRRQAVLQLHARSPVDVRRFYRREHPRITKALALFGGAALDLDDETRAREVLELVLADKTTGTPGWGYPFDVQTRWSFYAAGTPNIIVTSFAGRALTRAAHQLREKRYADAAADAAVWTIESLLSGPELFFVYHAGSGTLIHNANLLGAAFVWEALGRDPALRDLIGAVVERSLEAQAPDGSFPYGAGAGLEFVDSFHTGFVLDALMSLRDVDPAIDSAIQRGATYYAERFFGSDGEARLWADSPYPEDAHSAGTGLSVLTRLAAAGIADPELVDRVCARTLSHVVRGGTTVNRRYRHHRTYVNYPRWATGHVAQGLARAGRYLADPRR
jgi:hypothetical protein